MTMSRLVVLGVLAIGVLGLPLTASAQGAPPAEKLTQDGIYKLAEALGELHQIGLEIEALNQSAKPVVSDEIRETPVVYVVHNGRTMMFSEALGAPYTTTAAPTWEQPTGSSSDSAWASYITPVTRAVNLVRSIDIPGVTMQSITISLPGIASVSFAIDEAVSGQ